MNFNLDYSANSNRWRILMDITKTCPPKEFGAHVCDKKRKTRGGSKRR